MRFSLVPFAVLLLAACTYGPGGPPPLAPLSADGAQPGPALLEHVLEQRFSTLPSGADVPTICARLAPKTLSDTQEKALIARLPRLAPLERCKPSGDGFVDSITGERAEVIAVEGFECTSALSCSGWVRSGGQVRERYAMRWQPPSWRFARETVTQ